MQADWPLSLGIALALLAVGALLGELWSRMRGPRPERRGRRARPHYLLGLNYLVSNQPTHAIRELSRAVRQETDAVEAYLALGNLFRENGQTERAIDIHKSLLHRSGLSEWERTQVLFSLAMDFKKAGLIDRAERSLEEVGQRDPDHLGCLYSLQQIAEESGRWEEALRIHRRIQEVSGAGDEDLLPGLETEWGRALVASDADAAERHFRAALDLRPDYAPAHFGLGTCVLERAAPEAALEHLQQAVETGGAWALAALEPMSDACSQTGDIAPLERACEQILGREPRAWRAHLALARIHMGRGETEAASSALGQALAGRPASVAVQRQLWDLLSSEGKGIEQFVSLFDQALGDARLVDPYVCLGCRFKSAELFARCPHCHEWNTMTEERTQ